MEQNASRRLSFFALLHEEVQNAVTFQADYVAAPKVYTRGPQFCRQCTVDYSRCHKSETLHTSITTGTEDAFNLATEGLYTTAAHMVAIRPRCLIEGDKKFTRCANLRRRWELAVTFSDTTRVSEVPRRRALRNERCVLLRGS